MCKGRVHVHLKFGGEKDDVVYPLYPTVKVSARVKPQNCVRIALRTYFLPSGVTGLTSHWAVIQLTYWCERERAPPSEVAE